MIRFYDFAVENVRNFRNFGVLIPVPGLLIRKSKRRAGLLMYLFWWNSAIGGVSGEQT